MNLETEEARNILGSMEIPYQDILSGKRQLTEEEADKILNTQLEEKKRYFDTIKSQDFPEADITPYEEEALMSLGFNSPKLWGPNLRRHLKENNKLEAAKEILLRSNRKKEGGITRRRLDEAKTFAGKTWDEVVGQLSPEEISQLRDSVLAIDNEHTRQQVLERYPFLKQAMPRRFKQIGGKK